MVSKTETLSLLSFNLAGHFTSASVYSRNLLITIFIHLAWDFTEPEFTVRLIQVSITKSLFYIKISVPASLPAVCSARKTLLGVNYLPGFRVHFLTTCERKIILFHLIQIECESVSKKPVIGQRSASTARAGSTLYLSVTQS